MRWGFGLMRLRDALRHAEGARARATCDFATLRESEDALGLRPGATLWCDIVMLCDSQKALGLGPGATV